MLKSKVEIKIELKRKLELPNSKLLTPLKSQVNSKCKPEMLNSKLLTPKRTCVQLILNLTLKRGYVPPMHC